MSKNDSIKHVVLLMMENHSFDQMLGCLSSVYPNLDGAKSKNSSRVNFDSKGTAYPQAPTSETQVDPSPMHEHKNVLSQIGEKQDNSGFVRDYELSCKVSSQPLLQEIMGYYELGKLPALHALAQEFTVCDRWFCSLPGPTWPNRMFGLTGTSNGSVLMPEGMHQLEMLTNQTQATIFDRLNEKDIHWKIYFYDFPASLLLRNQQSAKNLAGYRKIDEFFSAAQGDESQFPQFTFIEPKYFGGDENDDHPPHNIYKAQKLIADVYNALRSNSALWESTLLVVYYDEHGGFYDHVVPPTCVAPDDKTANYSFNQLGLRVPAVLISPWVSKKCLNTQFDHTSLLKYLQEKWDLGELGNRTKNANSIGEALTELQPRTDTIPFIRVPYSDLMPKDPALETEAQSPHHMSLHMLGVSLESIGDENLENAIDEIGKMASAYARAKAWLGKRFINLGNSLSKDQNNFRDSRVQKTIDRAQDFLKSK